MKEEIEKCLAVLKTGGTICYPTDTIWGIGCDSTNEEAVAKVYNIKNRQETKSLILLVDSDAMLNRYVKEIPEVAWDLMDYSDKPITIIYSDACNLPITLIAKDGSIAIRKTKNEFCKRLIHKLGKPLVSTSANISGERTPNIKSNISKKILSSVDYVVDLQENSNVNSASTIIKIEMNGTFKIIRN